MSSPSKAVDVMNALRDMSYRASYGRLRSDAVSSQQMADENATDLHVIATVAGMIAALTAFRDAHDMLETEPDRLLVGMQMGCAYEMAVAALSTIGESQ